MQEPFRGDVAFNLFLVVRVEDSSQEAWGFQTRISPFPGTEVSPV
jgi:hypothetical protein